jgi:hypothetical protein
MLSLTDCIAMSELSENEIAAIAEHEHVPAIVAAELGCKLLHTPGGRATLKHYLEDNLANARARSHAQKARELTVLIRLFDRAHPVESRL